MRSRETWKRRERNKGNIDKGFRGKRNNDREMGKGEKRGNERRIRE